MDNFINKILHRSPEFFESDDKHVAIVYNNGNVHVYNANGFQFLSCKPNAVRMRRIGQLLFKDLLLLNRFLKAVQIPASFKISEHTLYLKFKGRLKPLTNKTSVIFDSLNVYKIPFNKTNLGNFYKHEQKFLLTKWFTFLDPLCIETIVKFI